MSMTLLKIVDPKHSSAAPEASQQLWAHMDHSFLLKGLLISSSEHLNESRASLPRRGGTSGQGPGAVII